MALAMLECGPPTEHRSGAEMRLLPDGTYHLAVGSTEMGNGSTTSHRQIAASVLGTRADRHRHHQCRHRPTPYDTGTFASTGTVVAGKAVEMTAAGAARRHPRLRQPSFRLPSRPTAGCEDDAVICGNQRDPARRAACRRRQGRRTASTVRRKAYLSPRTVAFNVQGVRLAVHRVTGEICILQSVHAADIGRLINPDAVPRPARRRHRHGLRLGAVREDGLRRRRARW